ncbi:chaperone modulator CbpM [uncultured Croceitalea sp.]|uniref:chaperone modulator CbpM n=1 Tax=uncultured Croceitalea sp. TaxID=1798908 RepID=UPI00374ED8F2
MKKATHIRIQEFCAHYNIEPSFVQQLQEYEIVEIETTDNEMIVHENEILKLEKMVRLHHELEINLEGLQAIHHLLEKVNMLQEEITTLRRKLHRFED